MTACIYASDELKTSMKDTASLHTQRNNSAKLTKAVDDFNRTYIYPVEHQLQYGMDTEQILNDLQTQARHLELYGSFFPKKWGGKITSLIDYLPILEMEGKTEFGAQIFGSDLALDIHTLNHFGNDTIQTVFAQAIASGELISSFGMSEPNSNGSRPYTFTTSARLEHDQWNINGKKWFICRADKADVIILLCRTDHSLSHINTQNNNQQTILNNNHPNAFSLIMVPTNSDGFLTPEPIKIFGRHQGQCELIFDQVQVPESYLLGQVGDGLNIIHQRLMLGRIIRSTLWLGLSQRCYELMCHRIRSPQGQAINLKDKQLIRQSVVNVFKHISQTRTLLHSAARELDQSACTMPEQPVDIAVNLAKLSAAETVNIAADAAIQVYGAEGVSDRTPLASIYQTARTTRILDGADEPLISSLGKTLLNLKPNE